MSSLLAAIDDPGRRNLLKFAAVMATASPLGVAAAQPAAVNTSDRPQSRQQQPSNGTIGMGSIGSMLAHEQFPVPELVRLGNLAAQGGFHLLATSDHLQPWQANEGHSGEAWITLGALSTQVSNTWMGTTVTCPILRYSPVVVAEAFAFFGRTSPMLARLPRTCAWKRAASWQRRWPTAISTRPTRTYLAKLIAARTGDFAAGRRETSR